MPYLLDTNIVIHALQGDERVLAKLAENDGAIMISALTLVELLRGVRRDPVFAAERLRRLEMLRDCVPVLPFDESAAMRYGRIIAELGWVRGRDYDRMIAAHAIQSHATLVTNNQTDFHDIPELSLENWL